MKKIINNVDNIVDEMLQGAVKACPTLVKRADGFNVLVRKDQKTDKVALVSGGGSGHEPSHAGFVGLGMLDGAIAGEVFTSPTPDQVYGAIKAVDCGKGVLLVIKNYSGDIMNFEMAAEMATAEGINVSNVIVNDDVAVEDSLYTTGRRGVAGTIFVHKIAGAAAEKGYPLEKVTEVANKVIKNVRTMGMSLTSCTVPAAGKPGFEIGETELEMGLGIHGEPGTHREAIKSADEITTYLLDKILADMSLENNQDVALMVNGLGGTPLMELYISNNKANDYLVEKNLNIYKTILGNYMTSLEMAGMSISVLKLDDELKELLDATANTPAFTQF